jgi:hypothetical protein
MWSLLPCLAFLYSSQADHLTLTNIRTTHGPMGAVRADEKILPGDQVALSFDIAGAALDASGKVKYSIAMEVSNNQGKVLFRQAPRVHEAPLPPGAKVLPACATLDAGTEQPPGEYTVKVSVKDETSGGSESITRTYQLLPKGFGLVRYSTTRDPDGRLPVAALRTGLRGWINFSAVGFERDPATGRPDVAVDMRVVGEDGRAILKPVFGEVKEGTPTGAKAIPMQFEVQFTQPGHFIMDLTATDKVTNQKATLKAPLDVSTR